MLVACPRYKTNSLNRTFALTVAAPMLYVIANSVPMLRSHDPWTGSFITVFGGVETLWQDWQGLAAALAFFTALLAHRLFRSV